MYSKLKFSPSGTASALNLMMKKKVMGMMPSRSSQGNDFYQIFNFCDFGLTPQTEQIITLQTFREPMKPIERNIHPVWALTRSLLKVKRPTKKINVLSF